MSSNWDANTLGNVLETWVKETTPAADQAESEQDYGPLVEPMRVLAKRLEELGEGPPDLTGPVQELVDAIGQAVQELETSKGWPPESPSVLRYADALKELSTVVFPTAAGDTFELYEAGDPAGEARIRELFREHGRPYPGDEESDPQPPPS